MKNNHALLLRQLIQSLTLISSKNLAASLNVSTKSITNYINEINATQRIIFYSNGGYFVDKKKAQQLLRKDNEVIPQTYDERAEYLIQHILSNHNEAVNIYKMCDELFVSYSTIKNDISRMNIQYRCLDIKFVLKKNYLHIDGSEKDKRKLMSKIIYDQQKSILNLRLLNDCFPNVQIELLIEIINKTMKKYNYYLNDFSRINMIIHYSIIIDRMKNGHSIPCSQKINLPDINSTEKAIIDYLNKQLFDNFNLSLTEEEMYEFLILIRVNAQKTEIEQTEIFKNRIYKGISEYVNKLIRKLKDLYYLDLRDDQFIVPFALHLSNLLKRITYNITINNPLVDQLKTNSPILYDVALFIAKDFCEYFGIKQKLPADEIGFITIHIGSKIEQDNSEAGKLNVVLVCPNYINLSSSIRNKLLYNLGSKIKIINTVNEISDNKTNKCDLLISTIDLESNVSIPCIIVSPFISDNDISNIYDILSTVKNSKTLEILKNDFDLFFNENNFIVSTTEINQKQAIHMMANTLYKNGYVLRDYETKVLNRESSSPTSFNNYAIPHSFEMDALISGICVLITKNGISWNGATVNIALMIAMNKKDNVYFYHLYDAILNLLADSKINGLLLNADSFCKFKSIIYK